MSRRSSSKPFALAFLIVASCAAAAASSIGCNSVGEEEGNDETSDDNNVTSANQLNGSDMAQGTYALTFDDGPGPRTEELANWLGDRGIVATFFINGRNAPAHEAALAAIQARGHTLANHTQNHQDLREQTGGVLYHAVADTDDVIARYQPNGPWLLRAPYGAWNGRVSEELNSGAMSKYVGSIFWNVGGQLTATTAADWACWGANGVSMDECANRYINEMSTRGRGIILMHDIHSKTVDMTKVIVERIGASHFVSILNAPQVAAAGAAPPPAPAPPPTEPVTPPTAAGCGTIDYKGLCEKNVLTWCENGALKTADCVAQSKVCSWKSDDEGHDCVAAAPCGDVTYAGSCNGDMLTWCDEAGALRQMSCAAKGKRCVLQNADTGFNCLP